MKKLIGLEGTSVNAMDCIFFTDASEINKITANTAITSAGENGAINIWLDDDMHFRCKAYRNLITVDSRIFSDTIKVERWAKKWLNEIN